MAFYGLARIASRFGRFARRGIRALARRRPARAFVRRPRRLKKTQNKVHTFVRWCDKDTQFPGANGPNVIAETGSNQNLVYTFKLDNVVNASEFTSMYDQYRINKVVLYLEPQFTSNGQFYNNLNIFSKKLRVIHDYNDANPLTQEDDYLEYANCKTYMATRNIRITLYPKIANNVENVDGGVAQTLMNSNRVWLNTAQDEVPHFGIKIFVPEDISNIENVSLFTVRAKMWLSMKNTK